MMEYIFWNDVALWFAYGCFAGFALGCTLGVLVLGIGSFVRMFDEF